MNKKTRRLSVGLLGLVFVLALISASPVEAKRSMNMDLSMSIVGPINWEGDVWTKDGYHGDVTASLLDYEIFSIGQKLEMILNIEWDSGGYIETTIKGFFFFATYESGMDGGYCIFVGRVTDTSPGYSEWNNRHVLSLASISPWPWVADGIIRIF